MNDVSLDDCQPLHCDCTHDLITCKIAKNYEISESFINTKDSLVETAFFSVTLEKSMMFQDVQLHQEMEIIIIFTVRLNYNATLPIQRLNVLCWE